MDRSASLGEHHTKFDHGAVSGAFLNWMNCSAVDCNVEPAH
ncbi:hypothetical protein RBSWK_06395 [Rhodopirellula baltica SWK14]|uniref:Uncharacterized protein n=1 Tax=Rhodopirellula baltica SWK14 TaxID=993516 RepID=L7C680_RHOBT|nr:hypothetical protein RBSWK_06395 [Rhodopirellula baltica SWK14]